MPINSYADGYAFIEGKYVPIDEARIPIMDTGFTRSDLTYDVVAVWKGFSYQYGRRRDAGDHRQRPGDRRRQTR